MAQIVITMTIGPEYADPDHPMGVTEDGYNELCERLGAMGTDIDVQAVSG